MTNPAPVPRAAVLVAGLLAVFGLGACRGAAQLPPLSPTTAPATASPSADPSATASPSASPAASPSAGEVDTSFEADGVGPYRIGASLADLGSRGLVSSIVDSPFCAGSAAADATGSYAGTITLSFQDGKLAAVHTTSPLFVTPSGARVGMTIEAVQAIYGSRGEMLTGTLGNKAFVVRVPASDLAVVFYLDPTMAKIDAMSGGQAQQLEDAVRNGEAC